LNQTLLNLIDILSTDLSISPKKTDLINLNFEYCKGDMETILEGIEESQDLAITTACCFDCKRRLY
jgi:hypothetical protein